ncbi:hypothetical protein H5410_036446 [Solanum commersonii]|uniref:Uncharacterized protein n=1 Tax=Solanum commersonii TaxID=4109 RepID=A0A9J5Y866_SOLCO|nr:hypothetical protein H5410_036446 [Solanum commersonii]
MSPKCGPGESPEYHPGTYYDGDDDDAPTWPAMWPIPLASVRRTYKKEMVVARSNLVHLRHLARSQRNICRNTTTYRA